MSRSRSLLAALVTLVVGLSVATGAPASTHNAAARAKQSAQLLVHPQLAQPGSKAASSTGALTSMTAVFKPARKGRVVALQRRKSGRWVTVDRARQDGSGHAEFNAPFKVRGKVATYRATTARTRKLAAKASKGVSANKWGKADFVDEFSGAAMSSTWSQRAQGYSVGARRECSKGDPRATRVSGGALRLSVLDDPDRADSTDLLAGQVEDRCDPTSVAGSKRYNYRLNGHVSTEGTKAVKYGYVAARMKFQPRAGQHVAFWMQPELTLPSTDPGAEIDVIEWFGDRTNNNTELTSFVYRNGKKYGGQIRSTTRYGKDWAKKYHVFSVEWTPSRYIFRIDGKKTYETTKGVSKRAEYLILSLLSSDYELGLLGGDSRLPQHMYVDWVKHWDLKR